MRLSCFPNKLKQLIISGLFIFCFGQTVAQPDDSNSSLRYKIRLLSDSKEFMEINRLINRNTSLEPEYSLGILTRNLDYANKNSDFELLAYTHLSLGNFWWFRSNRVKAFEHFFQSEKISREHDYKSITALAIMNRSHFEADKNIKIEMLLDAIGLFQKLHDTLNLAKAHLNLGQTFSDFVIADTAFQSPHVNREPFSARMEIYRDSAFKHYNIAHALNDKSGHPEIIASVNLHFAEWYWFEKDFQKAVFHLITAADFFLRAGHTKGHLYCKLQLAKIYVEKIEYEQAIQLLNEVEELSKKLQSLDNLVQTYRLFSTIYDSLSNYPLALFFHRLYNQHLIELNNNASLDKIHALNLEYKLLEQSNEILLLNSRRHTNRLIIVFLAAAILFTLVIAYLGVLNKRRKVAFVTKEYKKSKELNELQASLMESEKAKLKLEQELLEEKVQLRSERIIMIANQIAKLDSLLKVLNEDVKTVVKGSKDHLLVEKLNTIKVSLAKSMHEQSTLRELSALSDEVNQNFLFHIEQHYKSITKEDLKLLSYLIMNMGSKEIAEISNITLDSVHKKRYRLRQKLNIGSGKSFADFYRETLASMQ